MRAHLVCVCACSAASGCDEQKKKKKQRVRRRIVVRCKFTVGKSVGKILRFMLIFIGNLQKEN